MNVTTTAECEVRTFSREEFYELVWSAPATKLAAELGCSDVMICKVCKSHDIPKPYTGYWAQLTNGKKPERTPLPQNTDPEMQSVRFFNHAQHGTTFDEPPPELKFDADILEMLEKARCLGPVIVSAALRNPHPLVLVTKNRMDREKAENRLPFRERNYSWQDGPPGLSMSVSDEMTSRSLRVFDALIKRIEKIDGKIEIRPRQYYQHQYCTHVIIGGEEVTEIRLREKMKRVRITNPQAKYEWDRHRTELVPTGILSIDDGRSSYEKPLLIDTMRRKVEDGLAELIIRLITESGKMRVERREREEAERRRVVEARIRKAREDELRRRREELHERQAKEREKVNELVFHAKSWRKSALIRRYLDALCDTLGVATTGVQLNSPLAKYLRWGFQQADRMDPLRPNPPSILDETVDDDDDSGPPRKPR